MVVLTRVPAWAGVLGLLMIPSCFPAPPAGEYEIKAAFLYKFTGFVQWPGEGAGSPLCIGVLGQDPFGPSLSQAVQGRATVIRSHKPEELAGCRIVFIASSERKDLGVVLRRLPEAVLTVGDIPDFCERGGMIGFELVDQRIRLRINLDAAQRSHLQISSKLLSVAKVVGGVSQ